MLWSLYAFGTRTELWFGHGCSGHGMLPEHKRNYDLGLEALVTVCSWNTNGVMVWAWKLWSPYAFGTRREIWLGMHALATACSWNANGTMVWAWMLWSPYALGTRMELWFGHECSGHCMLSEHERNYGLGMDALVTVCSRNTNGIMIWAWKLWSPYALGTRTELWFGPGSSGHRMLLEHEEKYGWACMLWRPHALGTRTELWFGHGCSGHRMLLEHEWSYGLGMDALVTVCCWNTNGSIVWAWVLWSLYALGLRTLVCFSYGRARDRMHDIMV